MKKLDTEYTPIKRMIEESTRRLLIDMGLLTDEGQNPDIIEGYDFLRDIRGRVEFIEGDENQNVDIIRDARGRVVLLTQALAAENKLIHWYYLRDTRGRVIRVEPYTTELDDEMDDEDIELFDETDTYDGANEDPTNDDLTEFEAMTDSEMIEDDPENIFETDGGE